MKSTFDDLLWGRLRAEQPAEGFGPRVTVDTILLGAFVRLKGNLKALEVGCAHGILSLMLIQRARALGANLRVVGIDIQPQLVEMAMRNRDLHGMTDQVRFIPMDLMELKGSWEEAPFDLVVCNPPYEDPGSGRPSPRGPVALAVHRMSFTLEDLFLRSGKVLRPKGRFFMVMRSHRMGECLDLMRRHRLEPKRLRMVHPKPGRAASVFLVEAIKGARAGLVVESPLFIHGPDGEYTPDLLRAYGTEGF
ncbi:Methyltransferase type 11 [Thermanaerovibrio acidaminovorans DSM 6589]|uniref:Methyltransferase type 11 n=1 Tax=Thermanaerovibrio acidaminovorans (strain ATCC 49978 / DSM 6589 / Su883) TaxID=525903 RepID=D1B5Y9_THEAS|nr:methyltransferase domain-containing protein [Thermanaerovibrio acidaminovorans]ACZ19430.1 Methyltransferase type 11 [Thermanaerovibrio acidaminovorans DSM 6589]